MRLFEPASQKQSLATPQRQGGFTLMEMLFAMAIFGVVMSGILGASLLGLKMMQVNETKLAATDWSRRTFGKFTDEVHSSTTIYVGNMDNGTFTGLIPGEAQQGNALMIYPTTNTASYVLYYLDPNAQQFWRTTDQTNTTLLAESVTNTDVFSSQDFTGNVLTNFASSQVVHLKLQIYQPGHYLAAPDYYQLETAVVPRAAP
jgi:prepilin-type N-terminal cleavage/methylation domain-containing protein